MSPSGQDGETSHLPYRSVMVIPNLVVCQPHLAISPKFHSNIHCHDHMMYNN